MPTLPFLPEDVSRTHVRLGAFIALSLALHLMMMVGAGRFDLATLRPGAGPARIELHATLSPAPAPADAGVPATGSEAAAPAESAAQPAREERAPRAGEAAENAGLALPALEKWYTASEVDVRAEPMSDVRLRYPENLRGEPVVGKVHLRLFIDERGVVRKMQVAASTPEGMFDQAARQAWEDVTFSPAIRNGKPVKSQKLLELIYQPGLL